MTECQQHSHVFIPFIVVLPGIGRAGWSNEVVLGTGYVPGPGMLSVVCPGICISLHVRMRMLYFGFSCFATPMSMGPEVMLFSDILVLICAPKETFARIVNFGATYLAASNLEKMMFLCLLNLIASAMRSSSI